MKSGLGSASIKVGDTGIVVGAIVAVNAVGDVVSIPITADPPLVPLTYTVTGLPAGLALDGTGAISGVIADSAAQSTPYVLVVTATDGTDSTSLMIDWTVHSVKVTDPGSQLDETGAEATLLITAHDATGQARTFSATGLPAGLVINPDTGVISGVIDSGADLASPYTVTVTAAEPSGGDSGSLTFEWEVAPGVSLDNPGALSNLPGDSVNLQLTTASAGLGAALTFSACPRPSGWITSRNR